VASAAEIAPSLRNSQAPFVSTGTIELPDRKMGFRKSLLVGDPDGHAVEIVE
jgi:hypothetical protein